MSGKSFAVPRNTAGSWCFFQAAAQFTALADAAAAGKINR